MKQFEIHLSDMEKRDLNRFEELYNMLVNGQGKKVNREEYQEIAKACQTIYAKICWDHIIPFIKQNSGFVQSKLKLLYLIEYQSPYGNILKEK